MAVPTYDLFVEPILRHLALHPNGALARDVHEAVADTLKLSDADRAQLLPSGAQQVYKNRAGWAHDRLKRAGLSASTRRGFWQITAQGLLFARDNSKPLSDEQLNQLSYDFKDVRLRPSNPSVDANPDVGANVTRVSSPDDRLEEAMTELRTSVAAELLDVLSRVSPTYFETVVLDLLHRMGYGASRADLERVGGSGDGGIDGIISLDKLGLEKVYVQAKRWQSVVGRPEVQAFYGALAGQRASKGVFITTSSYSNQATDFARSVEKIVLVDGQKLAALMMDNEVGVTSRILRAPRLDSDYFDE